MPKTVAVDFDGTLHPYTAGWTGCVPEDEPPTEGALDFLQWCRVLYYDVVIFSTRAADPEGREGICEWLAKHGLDEYITDVTATKPPAVAYVDDRAVEFDPERAYRSWREARDRISRLAAR